MQFTIMSNGVEYAIMSLGELSGNQSLVTVQTYLRIANCPTSSAGLATGTIYKDTNGFLKIA
jgi:hypothetical protein